MCVVAAAAIAHAGPSAGPDGVGRRSVTYPTRTMGTYANVKAAMGG
jgi:hypothetical protein